MYPGKEAGMKRLCCWMFLLAVPLVLTSCSSSKPLGADQNQVIAERDREIAGLRAEIKGLKAEKARASDVDAELKTALADLEAERKIRVEGNRIVMENAVLFASGSETITPDGATVLDKIWNVLVKYSSDRDILIEGHTDNVPISEEYEGKYASNWELSSARSLTVLNYLLEKKDAKPSRLGAVGYGEYRPIADNSTEEGRKRNRRVVIVVGAKS